MNLITLENINKSYSEKKLLTNVSLTINEGDKIGLIGLNGAGKSTLLKIISERDEFFDGTFTKKRNIRIEFLEQNTTINDNATIIEQVFKGDTHEMKLLMKYEETLEQINLGNKSHELNNKLIELQSKIDSLNLWSLETNAKMILNKLGIVNYNEKMKNISGGQIKRVALATALISPCDLLVLDEPTNHLDSDAIEWLEEYLNNRNGALIMITHDRYFLDRVTNRILELDKGNLYEYSGNYTNFLEQKVERINIETAVEEKKQKLIQKELKWVRRGAKARTTKQKARLQRFDDLVSSENYESKEDVRMDFIGTRLGKKTIEIINLNKSYGERVLIKDFNYIFLRNDRVGIIGNNGTGKTTLLNIIIGSIDPDSGVIEVGETVKIGVFNQTTKDIDLTMRAIDYIKEGGENIPTKDGSRISASTLAEQFLFDSLLQYTKIEKLSGGERRRLQLLRVLMQSPNVLILDEPTNDLDIETLKILEDFLDEFAGIVIIVSHDRYFLDRTCNKIFSYKGNGIISEYIGNYSDYLIKKESEIYCIKENNSSNKTKQIYNTRESKPKFSFKEKKEFEEIDNIITELENTIEFINKQIFDNSSNYSKLNELLEEKQCIEIALLEKYERWEYLNELNEKILNWNQ